MNLTSALTKMGINLDSNYEYTIDRESSISAIDVFRKFGFAEFSLMIEKAVNIASGELKDKVKEKLVQRLPAVKNRNPKYGDRMLAGVRIGRFKKNDDDEKIRSVHILGTRDEKSGTFRLRFFEEGAFRHPDRSGRGDLPHLQFFRDAQNEVDTQQSIIKNI
jgi:hypothetical protein